MIAMVIEPPLERHISGIETKRKNLAAGRQSFSVGPRGNGDPMASEAECCAEAALEKT